MSLTAAHRDAFAEAYTAFHEPFMRYCASKCLGNDALEDVMQDAIALGLERWPAMQAPEQLLPYLIGIVKHRYQHRLRSQAVVARYFDEQRSRKSDVEAADPGQNYELELTLRAIDRLPEKLRETLLLHTVSGFSIREVAELQAITETSVKTRIHRARKQLSELLETPHSLTTAKKSVAARLVTLSLMLL